MSTLGPVVAIDTEAMGLNPHRDRLCLVQLSGGDGDAHLVQFAPGGYAAPRLRTCSRTPTFSSCSILPASTLRCSTIILV